MSLREMREMVGKNQVDVAAAVDTTQSELSRLERRNDFFLSTLKKYVKALGGELEIMDDAKIAKHLVLEFQVGADRSRIMARCPVQGASPQRFELWLPP